MSTLHKRFDGGSSDSTLRGHRVAAVKYPQKQLLIRRFPGESHNLALVKAVDKTSVESTSGLRPKSKKRKEMEASGRHIEPGVSYSKGSKKWKIGIWWNEKYYHLGCEWADLAHANRACLAGRAWLKENKSRITEGNHDVMVNEWKKHVLGAC